MQRTLLPLLLGALVAASCVSACIFKYGTSPDSLAAPHGGTHWDHGLSGEDWVGEDATGKPWMCMSGKRQSPINVPRSNVLDNTGSHMPSKLQTKWSYPVLASNGSNIQLINNGHTIQVEWTLPYTGNAKIAAPANATSNTTVTSVLHMKPDEAATYVTATPYQFHFHATSEHLLEGRYFPLELHIVHKVSGLPGCANGCYSVTGVLFELSDGADNTLLNPIWYNMPTREGSINYLPKGAQIELGRLLPKTSERDYVTYEGSLTTPPCSEGLLWHVMTQPQKISRAQWSQYRAAVGLKDCELKNATMSSPPAHEASPPPLEHRHHHHRHMLSEEEAAHAGNPEDYTCKVVQYGANFRVSQLAYGRTIKLARAT